MTEDQLQMIPTRLLHRHRNVADLEAFLAEHGLPRPTLAQIDAERKRRQMGGAR